MKMKNIDKNTLVLHRHNGDEIYEIDTTAISVSQEENKVNLHISLQTKNVQIKALQDNKGFNPQPSVNINLELEGRDLSNFHDFAISFPSEQGEEVEINDATIYYWEHGDLDNNIIKIQSLGNGRVHLTWTATTTDFDRYDGSVPDTTIEISGEFILEKDNKTSGSYQTLSVQQKNNPSIVNIEDNFESITELEISEFEEKYNLRMPLDYKDFLLRNNGGRPGLRKFTTTDNKIISRIKMFFPLTDAVPGNLAFYYEKYVAGKIIPENLLPIGEDPIKNLICLSLDENSMGTVFYWCKDDEEGRKRKNTKPSFKYFKQISNNFTSFLNNLSE